MAKKTHSYKKKNYRKKNTNAMVKYPKAVVGIPDKVVTKLCYCDNIDLGNGVGTMEDYLYRCNSVYDPDAIVLLNHQPMYYDQYAALYGSYRVLKSKITCLYNNVVNAGAGVQNSIIVGLDTLGPDSTAETNIYALRERSGAKYSSIGTQRQTTLSRGWNIKRATPQNADGLQALVTTNPTYVDYYRVWVASPDGASAITNNIITIQVKIVYTVEFYGLKFVQSS